MAKCLVAKVAGDGLSQPGRTGLVRWRNRVFSRDRLLDEFRVNSMLARVASPEASISQCAVIVSSGLEERIAKTCKILLLD